jgi:hypothetical protein
MTPQHLKDVEKANKLVALYKTPRARGLEITESFVDGTQYKGLPPWFSDTEVPVWDRKPCVKYRAIKSAIASNVDLLLGENRYPQVKACGDEDEEDDEQEDGLGSDESKVIERFLLSIRDEAELEPVFRKLYTKEQRVGACCVLIGSRNGALFAESLDTKWATVKRGPTLEIESVEIAYPYIDHVRQSDGWHAVAKVFRRVIDAKRDVTFMPGLCQEDGAEPRWTENPALSVDHNLGFVPVLWHKRNVDDAEDDHSEDGKPIHDQLQDEVVAIDVGLSMRHEAALYCRPERVEIGVTPGYNPTGSATRIEAFASVDGRESARSAANFYTSGRGGEGKRRRGPGWVNQFEDPLTKVENLENSGSALKALDDNIRDLRTKICETLAWVPLDPDSVKFAATVSGKALEVLRERQLNRVATDRETFGKGVMVATYQMMLRLVMKLGPALRTPGIKKALPLIRKMTDRGGRWQAPRLKLHWPPFFRATAEDEGKLVDTTSKAKDAGLITKRTAVEKIQSIYSIENVDLYLEALKKEAEEARAEAEEEMRRNQAKVHASLIDGTSDDDLETGSGGRQKSPAQGGSGKPGGVPGAVGKPSQGGKPPRG